MSAQAQKFEISKVSLIVHSSWYKSSNVCKMKSFPIVVCLTLFISFIFVAGESADKKEVLNAFTEVYDMMYAIRDNHAAQIKELMEQDLEKTRYSQLETIYRTTK